MTRGVLFFAFDNEKISYAKIAEFSASRVKEYLNSSVTVVTNNSNIIKKSQYIDSVIEVNIDSIYTKFFYNGKNEGEKLKWLNTSRYTCYDLSPYDETLVLDVDYIVNSNNLSYCWESNLDFLIYKNSLDLSVKRQNIKINYISEYSIPFYWATVFYFKKTELNKSFFNLVEHIKENWNYYRLLYQITENHFRNDYAFSIAIHMFNGFTDKGFVNYLPGKLYYSLDRDNIISLDKNNIQLLVESHKNYVPIKIKNLDLHLMNKFNLVELIDNYV